MSENPMLNKGKKFVDDTEVDDIDNDNKEVDDTDDDGVDDDKTNTESESAGSEFVNRSIEEKVRALRPDDVVRPPRKIEERSSIAIKLKKSIADKVKAYAFKRNLTVTEVLEDTINSIFKDEKLDKKALKEYNDKYKKKRTVNNSEE